MRLIFFCILFGIPLLLSGQQAGKRQSSYKGYAPAVSLSLTAENLWYRCRMVWLRIVDRQRLYRGINVALDTTYRLAFEDEFDALDRKKWRIGQPWGNIHPGQMHQWYSDSAVNADSGFLRLRAFYSPARLRVNNRDTVVPYQVGLICSDISFSTVYGYFELRCKNPSGPAVWPAFWLAPVNGWPPEIDIFEMYGGQRGQSIHRLTNSLHYGSIEAGNKGQRIYGIRLPGNTDKRFYVYGCLWKSDGITFYVNGFAVRKVQLNQQLQQQFCTPMYVLINTALQDIYLNNARFQVGVSTMELDYVRVFTQGKM